MSSEVLSDRALGSMSVDRALDRGLFTHTFVRARCAQLTRMRRGHSPEEVYALAAADMAAARSAGCTESTAILFFNVLKATESDRKAHLKDAEERN